MRRPWTSLLAALALVGCTAAPAAAPAPTPAPPGTSVPVPPRAATPPPSPSPTVPSPTTTAEPLVLAVSPARDRRSVPLAAARRVLAARASSWAELGYADRRLRVLDTRRDPGSATDALAAVSADPDALALVPASAVDLRVRALPVDRVDPLRDPERYPLTVPGPPPPDPATVTVVGDVMLGRRVGQASAAAGDPGRPLRPLQRRLAADLTIGNLESTLSRAGSPTQGGDSFAADPAVLGGLRDAGFDVLSLANNHTGDFGPRALVQTVQRVRASGIVPVGAGADESRAREPAVVERGGVTFGVLAANSIGETPVAGSDSPGAVPMRMPPRTGPFRASDLRALQAAVRELRPRVDVLVVLPHWGTQYTHVPEPQQRRVARALVDAGADVIAGGHPHWVQGVELHRGRLVAHSLGNFVFDMDFSPQTEQGVLLDLVVWGRQVKAYDLVPYRIGADFAPRLVSGAQRREILADVRSSSGPPFSAAPVS